jgi:hypothetical protein
MNKHPSQMTAQERADYRAMRAGPNRLIREPAPGLVVFCSDQPRIDGQCTAMAFAGKAIKPAWNYRFRTDAQRDAHIAQWAAGHQVQAERMAERAAARKAPHTLKVGDVLHSQWGYEQTNNDYYQVTALIGARMVEIREIGNDYRERGGFAAMAGTSRPMPGKFIGEPMRKVVNQYGVKVDGHNARPIDPNKETYESHYA